MTKNRGEMVLFKRKRQKKQNGTENGNKMERNANGHTVLRTCNGKKMGTIFLNVPYIAIDISITSTGLQIKLIMLPAVRASDQIFLLA